MTSASSFRILTNRLAVGCGRRARQQPHEDCGPVGGTIIAQTKSRLTISLKSVVCGGTISGLLSCDRPAVAMGACESRRKSASKYLANARHQTSVRPGFIGEMTRPNTNDGVSRRKLAKLAPSCSGTPRSNATLLGAPRKAKNNLHRRNRQSAYQKSKFGRQT